MLTVKCQRLLPKFIKTSNNDISRSRPVRTLD